VRDFLTDLHRYSGAADIVVARGGATNFAELAMQAKASVIVPNPLLTGGHQLKNAAAYEERGAVIVVSEADIEQHPEILGQTVSSLVIDPQKRHALEEQIHSFARPNAAKDLAEIVVSAGAARS
jgi:UDP-N-acetylglucosamine--N-acetylmuramyl-(pentapeptide) pyrophosphoryl-undecaprenol N-acetylglucosamine transferase